MFKYTIVANWYRQIGGVETLIPLYVTSITKDNNGCYSIVFNTGPAVKRYEFLSIRSASAMLDKIKQDKIVMSDMKLNNMGELEVKKIPYKIKRASHLLI